MPGDDGANTGLEIEIIEDAVSPGEALLGTFRFQTVPRAGEIVVVHKKTGPDSVAIVNLMVQGVVHQALAPHEDRPARTTIYVRAR